MVKKIIGTGLLLAVFTGLSGFAVAMSNNITADVIAEQLVAKKLEGLHAVYPKEGEIKDETEKYLTEQTTAELKEVNISYQGGNPQGVIYIVETQGYNGPIQTLVGFDIASQTITRVRVVQQSETPGLGDNVKQDWFSTRFQDKAATKELRVTKIETTADDEVQAITAATVSSRSVVNGVNIARQHFIDNFITP
ncbi:MAG: RnfABCDGE type electron transport complex subunit G [Peptococcia bacterium]